MQSSLTQLFMMLLYVMAVQALPQRVTENSFTAVELQQAYRCVRLLYPEASRENVIDITSLQLYHLKYMGHSQDKVMKLHEWTTKKVNELVKAASREYPRPYNNAAELHYEILKRELYNLDWTLEIFPTFSIQMKENPVKTRMLQLKVSLELQYYGKTGIVIHPEQRDCFFTNYELAQAYHHMSAVYPAPDGKRKKRALLIMAAAMQLDYLRGVCKSEYLLIAHKYITEEIHKLVADYKKDYSSISEMKNVHYYQNRFPEFKHWVLGSNGAMAKIVLDPLWLSPTPFSVGEESIDTLVQMEKLNRWLETPYHLDL